ncbi:hypothetical protein B0H14DRAFT_3443445 [Mycena olivaceomarginata]|nr:hypothetical protein B0H14DRAFT_3443445 [Mycena olivaceomarginata]
MWLSSLLFALLIAKYALAQGNDTIAYIRASGPDEFVSINYVWAGEPGHQLSNITFELMSGKAEAVATLRTSWILYMFQLTQGTSLDIETDVAIPAGPHHVRMNGTIFSGATQLSSTTDRSNTFTKSGPKCSVPHTPRIHTRTRKSGGPASSIGFDLYARDFTFDPFDMTVTMEVFSVDTAFNAGVQTVAKSDTFLLAGGFFTGNTTLNTGTWKANANKLHQHLRA